MEQQPIPPTRTLFSGLLNQHEFLQRLHFINTRIGNDYSTKEAAFLLGRTSYFLKDYEELAPAKMDVEDIINYTNLFKKQVDLIYQFDTKIDKIEISHEKRVVRGEWSVSDGLYSYQFIHPWTWQGICKPILLQEPIPRQIDSIDIHLKIFLSRLVEHRYFDIPRSPMEIYKRIIDLKEPQYRLALPLKDALYELVYSEQLHIRQRLNKIFFTSA